MVILAIIAIVVTVATVVKGREANRYTKYEENTVSRVPLLTQASTPISHNSTSTTAAPTTTSVPPGIGGPIASTLLVPISTSAPSKGTEPPPPSPTEDGVHLVNALNKTAGSQGSGLAYYKHATNGNNGAQPDDYAVVAQGEYVQWENHNTTGKGLHCGSETLCRR